MFKTTIEQLLTGQIICETAYPDQYLYLKVTDNRQRVEVFLDNLDRNLTYLESAEAFYCTFQEVDESNNSALLSLFSEVRSSFRPMVEFLELLLRASQTDLPIHAKSIVNINDLFEPFEHDHTLRQQLAHLSNIKPFKTNKQETREQLAFIFSKLEEMGYFVRKNSGSSRYFATARFDLIYLFIEFLNDAEQLQLPETDTQQQEELLF